MPIVEREQEELRKLKIAKKSIEELNLSYTETLGNIKEFSENLSSLKSLWKTGNKSKLVKLGLSLIVFPEPTPVTEIVGATLLSAGLIQQKIRNSGLHVEDIQKTFQEVFKNLNCLREDLIRY
ncbi:hypothetical protein J7K06_07245 [Candidatus Bathyarchaeota archaeon]|nr:hypothetical protein [Candidatus Bathyarchaeota archaeon]